MATVVVRTVAVELNRVAGAGQLDLHQATIAEQDELLRRAEILITRLRNSGISVLDPTDPALKERIDTFFTAVFDPRPYGEDEFPAL